MSRFVPIPAIPISDVPDWEVRTLNALKVNIELLTAILNKSDPTRQALLKQTYTLPQVPLPTITSIPFPSVGQLGSDIANDSSGNTLFWVQGPPNVASSINSLGTIADLERLRVDIANIRTSVEAIIQQFKTL
jgi:hypothetical protein